MNFTDKIGLSTCMIRYKTEVKAGITNNDLTGHLSHGKR